MYWQSRDVVDGACHFDVCSANSAGQFLIITANLGSRLMSM